LRIVGLKEFMTLENILYTEYRRDEFDQSNFLIKWCNSGTDYIDWIESPIEPAALENNCYDDLCSQIEDAEGDSTKSFKMDFEYTGRYANYPNVDDPIKFAVYEKDDIVSLITTLQKLI
jgi:hypothetical protein